MKASSRINILVVGLLASILGHATNKTAVINITANVVAACEVGSAISDTDISFGKLDFGYVPDLTRSVTVVGQTNNGAVILIAGN